MLELRKDIFADERDDNLKEIGKGTQRQDMLGHVTGASTYFNDHKLQGMLHLKVLRSPHSHARIRRIDASEAERHPEERVPDREHADELATLRFLSEDPWLRLARLREAMETKGKTAALITPGAITTWWWAGRSTVGRSTASFPI